MIDNFPIDAEYLVAFGVFLGVLLIFDGLRRFAGRARSTEALAERRAKAATVRSAAAEQLAALAAKPRKPGPAERMALMFDGAGIKMKPAALVAIVLGAGLMAFSGLVLFLPPLMAAPLAAALTVLLPIVIIDRMRAARLEKLTAELPDALELMARALKVGHPLNTSMDAVAKEMAPPISSEFARMVDQVTYGDEVVSAFQDLARRNKSEDLDYLAAAVAIQHGTGGNLARILEILSKSVRDRIGMRRKIHAVSAEGRISALILSLLPFAIIGMTHVMTPTYYGDVLDHPRFVPLASIALVLTVANGLILRKLVTFRF